ncbi:MAG: class I SAM-dependent methyltransferase [Anaerolineae bacterium]|nr:class I SAM-dependent methyltransferase [Anaerolineae bacterium]
MNPRQFYFDFTLMAKTTAPATFFERGVPLEDFWNNEYISKQMLQAHLDPNTDAASRKPETIRRSVDWIIDQAKLRPEHNLLDLGCGPGLYCTEFARRGYKRITGIDFSRRSIEYAREQAANNNLPIEYIHQNYLDMEYDNQFDVAMMIYCDFGVFSDVERDKVLKKVHRALKPGGLFIFDVCTQHNAEFVREFKDWTIYPERGFFSAGPHMELQNNVHYPEHNLVLDQYVILDQYGNTTIYNLWERYYSVKGLVDLLRPYGFQGVKLAGDLTGKEYTETSPFIAAIVKTLK